MVSVNNYDVTNLFFYVQYYNNNTKFNFLTANCEDNIRVGHKTGQTSSFNIAPSATNLCLDCCAINKSKCTSSQNPTTLHITRK